MVLLNKFNLVSLKEIYCLLKIQGYFNNIKTYQLCKFDLIVLLRNTKLFDEEETNHLLFYNPMFEKWIKLLPKKKLYGRDNKTSGICFIKKKIILNFD